LDIDAISGFQTWVLPALLGLGLASATGLRTFLPLLMLALAAKFGLFGIDLNDRMAWLADWPAISALAVASVVEFAGDKVPVVDHGLNVLGAFTRPIAGAVAAGSVFAGVDPMTAAIAGLIVGAPTAFAFNAAQGGARLTSTATTGGLGNPVLSFIEDVLSFLMVVLAFLAPVLVPILMIVLAIAVFRLARRTRSRMDAREDALRAGATRSP
jgi:hypothetical protein